MKKSAKGLIAVGLDENGDYVMKDQNTWEGVNSPNNQLKEVVVDGVLTTTVTLDEIRTRIDKLVYDK